VKDKYYRQSITVGFEYPVIFTRDVFAPGNPVLADVLTRAAGTRPHRAIVYVDSGVAAKHSGIDRRIEAYFAGHAGELQLALPPQILPGGETVKSGTEHAQKMVQDFVDAELCRHSFVMAIGGGAVLDAVGFAASLFHRGLRLVRLPSTVLAQNDVGVGVKNALNFAGGKNTIGTFSPPWAVVNDFDLLTTLSDRDWINGVSEAFKVAIIRDSAFFDFLCGHADSFREREQDAMERLIVRCAELHLEHIRTSGDPFEFGQARPLDFGHWSAHKLEVLSGYTVGHGDAVAAGIALDSLYATQMGWLTESEFKAIYDGLRTAGFSMWHKELEQREADGMFVVLGGIEDFRRHLGGTLYITFPNGIGSKQEVSEIDVDLMTQCIDKLKQMNNA